jgi:hypothetical protein
MFMLDCQAEPGRVWTAAQDPLVLGTIRLDNGPDCRASRQEEQL